MWQFLLATTSIMRAQVLLRNARNQLSAANSKASNGAVKGGAAAADGTGAATREDGAAAWGPAVEQGAQRRRDKDLLVFDQVLLQSRLMCCKVRTSCCVTFPKPRQLLRTEQSCLRTDKAAHTGAHSHPPINESNTAVWNWVGEGRRNGVVRQGGVARRPRAAPPAARTQHTKLLFKLWIPYFCTQAKADAKREYSNAVSRDGSLLHHLLRVHIDGQICIYSYL